MDVVSIKTPFIIYVREGGREKKGGGGDQGYFRLANGRLNL